MSEARQWLQRDISSGGIGKEKKNRFSRLGRKFMIFGGLN